MKLAALGTGLALTALALVAAAGAGGCEAIVSKDVPAYQCSMQPYVNPGTGSCPQGMFCEGAGCVACLPKGDDPCDGYDNDCDGIIDDGPKSDHDNDTYTNCGNPSDLANTLDCNDDDKTIHPKGHEVCNGKDDNCDGIIDNPTGPFAVCPPGETCVPSTGQCISNAAVCVACTGSNPPAGCCASPNVCDPSTQQCVAPASQDAGATGCTSSIQCSTGLCATSTELGPGQSSVCTLPCCTSADCTSLGAGYVCYSAGTGGNYCVPGTSVTGNPPATCCGDSNCSGGATCTAVSTSSTAGFACTTPPGSTTAYKSCNQNSDCQSGYCQAYTNGLGENESYCIPTCCSSTQCQSIGITPLVCQDDNYPPPGTTGPVVPVCDLPAATNDQGDREGTSPVGATCTKSTQCFSNRCLNFGSGQQLCSDVCCVDSDCNTAGWVCRPFIDGPVTGLRCVPPATE